MSAVNAAGASIPEEPIRNHTLRVSAAAAARNALLSECGGTYTVHQIAIIIRILVTTDGTLSKFGPESNLADGDHQSKDLSSAGASPGLNDLRIGRARSAILVRC